MSKKHDFEDVTVKEIPKKKKQRIKKPSVIFSLSGKKIKKMHTIKSRFGFIVLLLFAAAGGITALIFYILQLFSLFDDFFNNSRLLVGTMVLTFIAIGIMITGATLRIWFGRITDITEGLREIAKGNFSK